MPGPDTHDVDSLAGATYFVVGRGTEGGPSSYHLSIAGVTSGTSDPNWGKADKIAANSGYSLGTIQVDLGQRGTWALGATDGTALKPGETTYVDGIIDQAAQYAKDHDLKFTTDQTQLRTDLLTHGNGQRGRTTLAFIDTDTRDSINAWASSEDGQRWIHSNIDYPQIKHATQSALDTLEKYGTGIAEDRRLETIAILAKTANQMPSQMTKFENVLKNGGDYDDVLAKANEIKRAHPYYDGPKAASIAEQYKRAYDAPEQGAALDRAHARVGGANFDPSKSASDPDIKQALKAIGQGERSHAPATHGLLRQGSHGDNVITLQTDLARLGFTDAHDRALQPDGDFGPGTKAAVEKFQRIHALTPDGVAGRKTLEALQKAALPPQMTSLADRHHPGNALYTQALQNVRAIDAEHGRVSDHMTVNFAGALAATAHAKGMDRIDQVVLSDDATRAFAIQSDPRAPFKRFADVDVAQSVAKPLEQSSTEFHMFSQQQNQQRANAQQHQQPRALQQPEPEPQGMHR